MRKLEKKKYEFVRGQYDGLEQIVRLVELHAKEPGLPASDRQLFRQIEIILVAMNDRPWVKKAPVQYENYPASAMKPWVQRPSSGRTLFVRDAIQSFNELAKENPVTLEVVSRKTEGGLEVVTGQQMPTPMSFVLLLLWQHYFKDEGWKRIKRCPICERWFVDDTKNRTKIRCSDHCTAVWWNRSRRKQAGHKRRKRMIPKKKRRV